MINQITPISQRATRAVPEISRELIQGRRIQARLKGRIINAVPVGDDLFFSSLISNLSRAG